MFTNNLLKLVFVISVLGWVSLSEVKAQLIASTESAPTYGETTPTQSAEKKQLTNLLQNLQEIYGTSFMYERHLLEDQPVSVDIDAKASLETNLKHILSSTKLRFKKINNSTYVIIIPDSEREVKQVKKQPLQRESDDSGVVLSAAMYTAPSNSISQKSRIINFIDREITGTVRDEENVPLPGVNVVVKNTTIGTITGIDGNYTLSVPDDAEILVFSSVGYAQEEVGINGRSIVDLSMTSDITELGEVVVTALGIEKDSRTLGYATATVDPEEFTVNRTPNVMNALQGKIAGVNISSLGTGPGGTSKIRIRGQSSISGQNNPLIVINGVPIDNTNFGTNPGGGDGNALGNNGNGFTSDGGDGLNSINPDDIENMTVLKGAAAAALYGSRAKDGVIMITTKKGKGTQGIGVTYNLNYTNEQPLDFTDYQYQYGQGENGVRPTSENPTSGQWSFGERIQPGMTQILFDGIEVPYVAQRDRIDKFFRNGQNVTNTVSIAAGGENGSLNLSLSNLSSQGIVPNNSFTRRTVNLGFQYELSQRLSVTGAVNYSNEYNDNPPNVAQQDNTIPVALYNMANTMPLDLLDANKYNENGDEFVYSRFRNRTNPYFTLAEQFQDISRDRVFGNIAVKYDLADWIYVQGRIGQDYWSRDQSGNNYPTGQASRPTAPDGFVNGTFTQEARRFREINADLLINAYREFGDIGVNLNLGGNQMYRRSDRNFVEVDDFVIRDLYTVQNGRVKNPQYSLAERGVNSLYASVELSYKDILYLNGTFRNDWFSTLSPENRSISYPSVSASYVFTESFNNSPGWLTFGKLRAAYAEVGSDTDVRPYSDVLFYDVRPNLFATPGGANQPVIQISGNNVPNPDLRPMRANEAEIGLELQLFDSRVGLDVAVYQKTTSDQIVSAQVSEASGFDNTLINSGQSQTRGFEFLVNVAPIVTNDFRWNVSFNGMYNITEVLSLLTDETGETITVGNHVFNGFLQQVVGQEIGQLAGFGYRRDSQGRQIFGGNGVALRTEDLVNFGSALPNWVGGITNSFNYKGLNFSFLIDFKLGNMMMSGTNFNATRHGLHMMTLEGRENGVIGDGVNEQGEINTVAADPQTYWEVVRSQQLVEPIVYDGGYWKLRQISLGYDFSKFLPESFPAQAVTLNFVANNVFIIQKWVPNIDPESFGFTSDNLVGLESTGLPTTRGLGFNLNVKF
ncbi:MAG: SusC/RagA family TonB-linked outer membrane protein [Tunicatimonas sp.]|uniref:SusC/RagA family TonB-linked outer membrane protein n=1 Tax=Tunicatimonas sp. TaxID=1940096 RepID=UPI003C7821E9